MCLSLITIQRSSLIRTDIYLLWCTYLRGYTVLGASVVDWLISWSFVDNRSEGQRVGQDLIKRGYIQSIDPLTIALFRDQITAFYRFVSSL